MCLNRTESRKIAFSDYAYTEHTINQQEERANKIRRVVRRNASAKECSKFCYKGYRLVKKQCCSWVSSQPYHWRATTQSKVRITSPRADRPSTEEVILGFININKTPSTSLPTLRAEQLKGDILFLAKSNPHKNLSFPLNSILHTIILAEYQASIFHSYIEPITKL